MNTWKREAYDSGICRFTMIGHPTVIVSGFVGPDEEDTEGQWWASNAPGRVFDSRQEAMDAAELAMQSAPARGGRRDGAGRKAIPGAVLRGIKLPPDLWAVAKEIGGGNAAEGIRRALRLADKPFLDILRPPAS